MKILWETLNLPLDHMSGMIVNSHENAYIYVCFCDNEERGKMMSS